MTKSQNVPTFRDYPEVTPLEKENMWLNVRLKQVEDINKEISAKNNNLEQDLEIATVALETLSKTWGTYDEPHHNVAEYALKRIRSKNGK